MPHTQLLDRDLWQLAWSELPSSARVRVESHFPSAEPPPFLEFVLESLQAEAIGGRPGPRAAALLDSGLVVHSIANPTLLPSADAIHLGRMAIKVDYRLDDKLLAYLGRADRRWPDEVPEAEVARVLEVIDAISDCRRIIMPLMKFLKLRQPHLRSKVVKLIARASQNPNWADTILGDSDPRVRSNLIEGLWTQRGAAVNNLLQRASKDPHHRVAVTALLEMCRRDLGSARAEIQRLATEGDEPHRRAAEWALRQLESKPTESESK